MPTGGVLAGVGSTKLADAIAWSVVRYVFDALSPDGVVSGGAVGIDKIFAAVSREHGIEPVERLPEVQRWWSADGRKGFAERNMEIATDCTSLVRIPWKHSRTYGSGWTRDRAREMGKPTAEIILPFEWNQ